MTCTQPGCTGSILDGYCDVCGMAADSMASAGGPPAAPASPAAALTKSAVEGRDPCHQPGCTGKVLDGYCDVCGSPAVPNVRVSELAALAEEQPLGTDETTSATAASRVASAAIGSRRAGTSGTHA
ncbi:MAG: serine/threonine protein kinase, partial [Nocardioidaceae bacterium]|nr:serine/threonine protein kinase [Nocardioidaceae bacterium]